MKTRKYNRQRDAILNNLSTRLNHPMADMIYRDPWREYPRVSLDTAYRNLSLFTELGQVRKIHCEGGTEHYDFDTSNHCHFVYEHYSSVVDLPLGTDHTLNALAEQTSIETVECYTLVFYGVCRSYEGATKKAAPWEQVAAPL